MGTTSCYKFFSSKTVVDSPAKLSSAPKQSWILWSQTRDWSEKGKQKSWQKFNASSSDHIGNYSLSLSLSLSLISSEFVSRTSTMTCQNFSHKIRWLIINPVLLQDTSAAAGWQRSTTTSSCKWLVTLNGAKSRLLKSLIRAAKRIYVQQVMLQQKFHELGKKTKAQKRRKEEEEQEEAQQPISDLMVDLQSFYGFILVVSFLWSK